MTRRTILAGLALAGVASALNLIAAESPMRASKPEVRKDVVAVIEAQLAAFRKGDAGKAYSFASAELRAQKPLRVFTSIVQQSYPEIWRNTRAEFGIVRDDGQQAQVTVHVYAEDADAAYDFTLKKERSDWRIYGVLRHAAKQTGKV
jgi:hypothetical protein